MLTSILITCHYSLTEEVMHNYTFKLLDHNSNYFGDVMHMHTIKINVYICHTDAAEDAKTCIITCRLVPWYRVRVNLENQ